MGLFGRVVVLLWLAWGLLGWGVRSVGLTQPPPTSVDWALPSTGCAAPCWQGLPLAGLPTWAFAEFVAALPNVSQPHDHQSMWEFYPEDTLRFRLWFNPSRILILEPQVVQVGDVVAALGPPPAQTYPYSTMNAAGQFNSSISLYYPRWHLLLFVNLSDGHRLSPSTPVSAIWYIPDFQSFHHPSGLPQPWRGWAIQ